MDQFLILISLSVGKLGIPQESVWDLIISAGVWKSWFIVPWLYLIVLVDSLISSNNSQSRDKKVKSILTVLTASGLTVALIALFFWLKQDLTYDGRLKAFYLSPNHLAMYLSPILVLSFYLYFFLKKKLLKIMLFITHCLLFFVIYLTFSYGAWLGLISAFIFLSVSQRKKNSFYFIIFMLILIILSLGSQLSDQKLNTFLDSPRSSLTSRLIIWRSALEIIKDHPWLGIGPGLFQKYYLAYQVRFEPYLEWAVPQPHNLFLAFWLQTGLIGLIGFVWLMIIFFRQSFKKLKSLDIQYSILIPFLMAVMIYFLVHGLIDTPYWKNDLSVVFWLVIGLAIGLKNKESRLSY